MNNKPDEITLDALEAEKGDVGQRLRTLMEEMFELSQQQKFLKSQQENLKVLINQIMYGELGSQFRSITDTVFGNLAVIPSGKGAIIRSKLEENLVGAGIPAATVTRVIEDSRATVNEYTKYMPPRAKKEQ